jgi:hypothetical protein
MIHNEPSQAKLERGAKAIRVQSIDSAIHEPEAVRRTYECVGLNLKYRSTVNAYALDIAKGVGPSVS